MKIANQSLQPLAARWAAPAELFVGHRGSERSQHN